jgi:hypothetical protein
MFVHPDARKLRKTGVAALVVAAVAGWQRPPTADAGEERIVVIVPEERERRVGGVVQKDVVRRVVDLNALERDQLFQWICGGADEEQARVQAELRLQERMSQAAAVAKLTEAERSKLLCAGRGDLQRFFAECEGAFPRIRPGPGMSRDVREVVNECQRLNARFQTGLHEEGSLFEKTLRSMLSEEQRELMYPRQPAVRADANAIEVFVMDPQNRLLRRWQQ